MKRKHVFYTLMCLLLTAFASCSDDNNDSPSKQGNATHFTVSLPEALQKAKLIDAKLVALELNTKRETEQQVEIDENDQFTAYLKSGLYYLTFSAKTQLDGKDSSIKGYLQNVQINQESSLKIDAFNITEQEDFVIEEIFYTGVPFPETNKANYIGDQYFRITNNSDRVLYADGLAIAETAFTASLYNDYTPNIMKEASAIHAIYQIKGDGKTYPVEPGASIIICDKAIDHTEHNANSFDLSNADFEWYDESTVPGFQDSDNPDVPNLDKIYSYSRTVWIISKQANRSYLLIRMGEDKETFLAKYKYDYSYETAAGKVINKSDYKVPNSWIIDAVNLGVPDKHKWFVLDSSLDAGATYCGENSSDPNRLGKSVRRKVSHINEKGRKVLLDTNNSTEDFERNATPSVAKK